jgi:cephalosporin-C deacetylase-like acetyl esterase
MEEKNYFTTSDGLRICGTLNKPEKKTQKCVILCHGLTVTKDEDGILLNLLENYLIMVLRFFALISGDTEKARATQLI